MIAPFNEKSDEVVAENGRYLFDRPAQGLRYLHHNQRHERRFVSLAPMRFGRQEWCIRLRKHAVKGHVPDYLAKRRCVLVSDRSRYREMKAHIEQRLCRIDIIREAVHDGSVVSRAGLAQYAKRLVTSL